MSDMMPLIMKSVMKDGSACITVSREYADHMFTVEYDMVEKEVMIEHEESQVDRGRIITERPCDEVYNLLTSSEEFQEYITGFVES